MALYIAERLKERVRRMPILRPLLGYRWRRSMIRSPHVMPRQWLDGSVDGFLPEDLIDVVFAFHVENPDRTAVPRRRSCMSWPPGAAPSMTPGTTTCTHARIAIARCAPLSTCCGRGSVPPLATPSAEPRYNGEPGSL